MSQEFILTIKDKEGIEVHCKSYSTYHHVIAALLEFGDIFKDGWWKLKEFRENKVIRMWWATYE